MTNLSKTWFNNAWIREALGLPMSQDHRDYPEPYRPEAISTQYIANLEDEVAALKAERDELLGYNKYAVAECNQLRAALEEIIDATKKGLAENLPYIRAIARRTLEGK